LSARRNKAGHSRWPASRRSPSPTTRREDSSQTPRAGVTNYLTPGNALFAQFDQVYSSNPRVIQLAAKFTF